MKNPIFRVSDQVQHKPGFTATEDGLRGLGSRGIILFTVCSENKGTDQLHDFQAAYLLLCFCIGKKQVFS